MRVLLGVSVNVRRVPGDDGGRDVGFRLEDVDFERHVRVRAEPRGVFTHRQDERVDYEHRGRHQGLDVNLRLAALLR